LRYAAAREVGFLGFGFYPRSGFMHIDLGPARQWGERFPPRATAFAAETAPSREVLAQSRTMKGSGAAVVATLGAAGVEVAQDVLAETQSAVLPLVPYLDTLRWVFIAVALAGIAVTIYAREFQTRAAEDLAFLPERSPVTAMLSDYAVMREQLRSCDRTAPVSAAP